MAILRPKPSLGSFYTEGDKRRKSDCLERREHGHIKLLPEAGAFVCRKILFIFHYGNSTY